MAEQQPHVSEKKTADMDIEELEAVMQGKLTPQEHADVSSEDTVEPQQPELPLEQSAQQEEQPQEASEETQEASEETEQKPEPEEPPADPPMDLDLEVKILQAKLEQEALSRKHWEQIAGRHGSKIGMLETQLRQAQMQPVPQQQAGDLLEDEEPQAAAPLSSAPPANASRDELREWAVDQAATSAYSKFLSENPSYADSVSNLKEYMSANGISADALYASGDPRTVEDNVRMLLSSHQFYEQNQKRAALIQELEGKRADSTKRAEQARQAAALSGSGQRAVPAPAPKTLNEMSLEELDQLLDESTGGRW